MNLTDSPEHVAAVGPESTVMSESKAERRCRRLASFVEGRHLRHLQVPDVEGRQQQRPIQGSDRIPSECLNLPGDVFDSAVHHVTYDVAHSFVVVVG